MDIIARYIHPQGSTIVVYDNGAIVKTNPKGKVVGTSATAEKLAAGHGGWILVTDTVTAETIQTDAVRNRIATMPKKVLRPMKFKEAKVADLPRFVNDPHWALQQKLDGIRAQLVFERDELPWFRNTQGEPLKSTAALGVANLVLSRFGRHESDPFTVDGEILNGAFWVFDLVWEERRIDLWSRMTLLETWHREVSAHHDIIKLLPTAYTPDVKVLLVKAVEHQDGEGWIAKRLDSMYDFGARVEHSLKIKRTHTVDCVVTGRNVKRDDNFVLGLYSDGELIHVGNASAIGKPDAQVGDVVEVKYLYCGAGNRLVQPSVLRMRDDKPASECTTAQLRFADKKVVELSGAHREV
jgi:ATP-dependent DNA ligase